MPTGPGLGATIDEACAAPRPNKCISDARQAFLTGGLLLVAGPAGPPAAAQSRPNPLRQVLRHDTTGLGRVLAHPAAYRLQILYTRIRRDAAGQPQFRRTATGCGPANISTPPAP